MIVKIYAQTSLLEKIALDRSLDYVGSYEFEFVVGEDKKSASNAWSCGEFELLLPTRDQAVMIAQRAIQAEAASMEKYYADRLSKLLAITWEPPT